MPTNNDNEKLKNNTKKLNVLIYLQTFYIKIIFINFLPTLSLNYLTPLLILLDLYS